MGLWIYQEHKSEDKLIMMPKINLFDSDAYSDDWIGWQIGKEIGSSLPYRYTTALWGKMSSSRGIYGQMLIFINCLIRLLI